MPGTTGNDVGDEPGKFTVDRTTVLPDPFSLDSWLVEHADEINGGCKTLFEGGEFNVVVYGPGTHCVKDEREMWFWQKKG